MQISDMLGKYNRNVKNGTEELHSAQGSQKLVSVAKELAAGSIFEGTVNSVRNGKVTLALGNGQIITARLDGKVGLQPGTSMFFEVKTNDGTTVAIRPYTGSGNAGNPILLNALTAAQVPVTERNLTMVNIMMQEQMPIDRQSIADMAKLLSSNPQADVATVVRMTKLSIPVTEDLAAQFENYLTDKNEILKEMDTAVKQLTGALTDKTISASDVFTLNSQILDILLQEGAVQGKTNQTAGLQMDGGLNADGSISLEREIQSQDTPEKGWVPLAIEGNEQQPRGSMAVLPNQEGIMGAFSGETIGQLLDESRLSNLTKLLQNVPTLTGNPNLFTGAAAEEVFVDTMLEEEAPAQLLNEAVMAEEAVLNKNLTSEEFLLAVRNALAENSQYGFAGIQKLFAGKEYRALLKHAIEQQWTVKPQDLKEEHKISGLYEKMDRQMKQMENAMKMAGISQNSFTHTAADIRSNIEFMHQINQMYAYVQVPLKLTGQNANGELYVYTNKKNLSDPDTELTAFLHLDLENLGSTDVSIKMREKNVKTNFYLSDDISYNLIQKHLPILEKRLKQKGYTCSATITNQEKKVNFVDDFLKKDHPQSGTLHRYSFDVKA